MIREWRGCKEKLEVRGGWGKDVMQGSQVMRRVGSGTSGSLLCLSGPSVAVLLLEVALGYLIVVTFLVATTVIIQPTDFSYLKSKKGEQSHQGWTKPVHREVILPKTSLTF